jgi:hypothetical protein
MSQPEEKTIDAKKGDARDDRLHYIRKTQQEVLQVGKLSHL